MSGFGCYKSEESKDILVVYDNFMEFLIFSQGFVRIFIKCCVVDYVCFIMVNTGNPFYTEEIVASLKQKCRSVL